MVLRQHDPMVVEEMVVAGGGADGGGDGITGLGAARMPWPTRWWVEVTKPIPQVKGEMLAYELVYDGDDATLGMHNGTEREDVFAKDGSLPDPACKVQIKGLNINWGCTVPRRLALRRSSRKRDHQRMCGFIFSDRVCCTLICRCLCNAYHSE